MFIDRETDGNMEALTSRESNISNKDKDWRIRERSPKSLLKPLQKVQTACLWSITGGYKRTATALLEKEANIPPLQLYIKAAVI